ncbi:glyoxalase domain-containing protein 4-like [Daphnia pulex]|uniref:glyoxalase domain-containing protein 4-like n=1 Tax=Daphnia pulex TaxID=6669 RepID=UPI001EDCFCEB|nr:glyoxalase domain-containing protein 4-like [Daphnia pulex]
MSGRRALHFVFKVGNRTQTIKFYKDVLGMKILRHEEFEEGCKAACNGPYDGKWSKTMIGYGPEDNHFVCELTYNYGLSSYKLGNDFVGLTIKSSQVLQNAEALGWPIHDKDTFPYLEAPGGYKFYIVDELQPTDTDPVQKVTLAISEKDQSLTYWSELLKLKLYEQSEKQALLGYADDQAKLELKFIGEKVEHCKAFGRIAFSCPSSQLKSIESEVKAADGTILTPFVSLDTPGKATVQVVILADPDGHEICFVGDEGFRELSRMDPAADGLLSDALAADHSDEWFTKKGLSKAEA